jgi:hypothetical protein
MTSEDFTCKAAYATVSGVAALIPFLSARDDDEAVRFPSIADDFPV